MIQTRSINPLDTTIESHPTPDALRKAIVYSDPQNIQILANLWMTEGIPAAFLARPSVYEKQRIWLADKFKISPKAITLVGSSRLGYSLKPESFGKPFGDHSDLDIIIVSEQLFESTSKDFQLFVEDFESGRLHPRNEKERGYWLENCEFYRRNIPKGFLNANYIPNFGQYAFSTAINNAMYEFQIRVNDSHIGIKVKSASARIYKDWKSCLNRIAQNLSGLKTYKS
jgi:hypothetical protein